MKTVMMSKSSVFDRLRPICVQLTKEHTRDNVTALSKALIGLDRKYIQELQEYVFFPLRIILKQQKKYPGELYVDIYTCMESVLSRSCVTQWALFLDIFNTACVMLSDPSDCGKVSKLSEELKLAIIQMLVTLLKSSDFSIIQNLFGIESLPVLGHAVSVLLNIADQERLRPLKIAALNCLMELCQEDRKYCSGVKVKLGDTLASFLPGVCITLSRIITLDTHQGQAVIKTAIELLTKFMRLVLDNKLVKESRSRQAKLMGQGQSSKANEKVQSLVVQRNDDWLKSVGSKLTVIVKQVSKAKGHSSWKVRLALVDWASTLLNHCNGCLSDSVPDLLEVLVGRIGDDYPSIATRSMQELEKYAGSYELEQCRPLVEILEDNLHSLSLSLPRQMHTTDEDGKLATVKLLSGYLELLGPQVHSVLTSSSHAHRLFMSLVQVLEMDCSDVKIVEERTTIIGHGASVVDPEAVPDILHPKKYFRHFHDNKIYEELRRVCQCLGCYGNTQLLVDQVLDIFHLSAAYRPQAIIMLNEIITGTSGTTEKQKAYIKKHNTVRTNDPFSGIIRMLIDEYLSPSNFDLETKAADIAGFQLQSPESRLRAITLTSNDNTVSNYNRNIVQICLLLEGLGCFAKALGESYVPLLMQTLYPMLVKLGDDTSVISSAAYLALCDTCSGCQYRSVDELIKKNADYLVNAISLRLRHFHDNQKSPLVLKVVLQYSSPDILPLIDDTVHEILDALDDHYSDQAKLFMDVLHELTRAVVRWFPVKNVTDEDMQGIGVGVSDLQSMYHSKGTELAIPSKYGEKGTESDLLSFVVEYCEQKRIARGEVTDDDIEDVDVKEEDLGNEESDKEEKSVPTHVTLVKEVMMRCKHLLSSQNPRLRLLVLDTVSQACLALADHTNELLPLIHEVWPSFCARFVDDEKLVTRKALDVLSVMTKVSGDFLQQRVIKDVLTKLTSFLDKQSQISVQTGQAYLYTVNYKLQHAILQHLGSLCLSLDLGGNALDKVMSSCVVYLSSRQPKPLQQVSMETCKQLAAINVDGLWLKLCDLYCIHDYIPPHPVFLPVKFRSHKGVKNDFTDNIQKVFNTLELR